MVILLIAISTAILIAVCIISYTIGYANGKIEIYDAWQEYSDSITSKIRRECSIAPQPIEFPNGEILLLKNIDYE